MNLKFLDKNIQKDYRKADDTLMQQINVNHKEMKYWKYENIGNWRPSIQKRRK